MAQVFIFNATQSPVAVHVNGDSAAARLGGAGRGNGYAPPAQAIGRGNMAEPGRFGPGANQVQLVRESGMSQGLFLQIGHQIRPDMDLQLYLFSEHALLVSGADEVVFNLFA